MIAIKKINPIRIISYIFFTIFAIGFLKDIFSQSYDWDLDREIYFGNRLLKGELLYLKEFNDKLPLVQLIFSIPSLFKDIRPYTITCGITALISIYFFYSSLIYLLKNRFEEIKDEYLADISLFSSSLYLYFIVNLQNSLNHISALSSILTLIIFSIYVKSNINQTVDNKKIKILLLLLSTITISIRPYLIVPISLLPLWGILSNQKNSQKVLNRKKISEIIKAQLKWILPIIFLTVIFNIFPYLITGNIAAFNDGIRHNSQELLPSPFIVVIYNHIYNFLKFSDILTITFVISFASPAILFIGKKWRRLSTKNIDSIDIDIIFFSFIFPFSLFLTFLIKHFHSHYYHMYTTFICFTIPYVLITVPKYLKISYKNYFRNKPYIGLSIIVLILILIKPEIINLISQFNQKNFSHPATKKLEIVKEYIGNSKINFLYPDSEYIHWQLGEARHGFPQAANIKHIDKGYWNNINKSKRVNTPLNNEELCEMYNKKGPSLIILDEYDESYLCLSSLNSEYKIDKKIKIKNDDLIFFKRNIKD